MHRDRTPSAMEPNAMQTAQEILNAAAMLPPQAIDFAVRKCENAIRNRERNLRPREVAYVSEFCIDFNDARASMVAGYRRRHMQECMAPVVQAAVRQRLEEHSRASTLSAEYVREYIKSILDLCPTDYFELGPDGDWTVDPEKFSELPVEVKRLVESIELRWSGKRKYLAVKFVSKASALAMAARYTLVQQIEAKVATTEVPWEAIAERTGQSKIATIEDRIASVGKLNGEHREAAGPVLPG